MSSTGYIIQDRNCFDRISPRVVLLWKCQIDGKSRGGGLNESRDRILKLTSAYVSFRDEVGFVETLDILLHISIFSGHSLCNRRWFIFAASSRAEPATRNICRA